MLPLGSKVWSVWLDRIGVVELNHRHGDQKPRYYRCTNAE